MRVAVVGGGVTGASVAYHLARRGADVVLLERARLAAGPTGRSTAVVRQHYSQPLLVRMAVHGLGVFRDFAGAVGGSAGFVETGVLWVVAPHDRAALEANVELAQAEGADIAFLEPDGLAALDGRISTEGIGSVAHEPTAGYCDPYLATAGLAAAAEALGARVDEGLRVTGVGRGRAETVAGAVEADAVVVAAGPWSRGLLAPLGYDLPIRPVRAQVGRWRLPAGLGATLPTLADFSSLIYLKPGEAGYLEVGSLDPAEAERTVDPDSCPEGADAAVLATYEAALARRVPTLAGGHWRGAWSGVYDVTPDWHPAIGRVPGADGVFVAAGFSGHGFKLAPAVGVALAELVLDGRATTFDLAPLDPGRFERGELLAARYGYSVVA